MIEKTELMTETSEQHQTSGVAVVQGSDSQGGGQASLRFITRYGLLLMLAIVIVIFGLLEPDSFFTIANARSTASIAAPLMILAVGLTVPLGIGEFDLSIGNSAQLGGAVLVWLISSQGLPWLGSIGLLIVGAAAMGLLMGLIVVKSQVNAFIITLGAGTVFAGLEFGVMRGATVYSGIPPEFTKLAVGRTVGIPNSVLIAAVFAAMVWVGMERTVAGRQMRAAGGNAEAARLAGVRVDWLRACGFVVTAVAAAVAATILMAQSASYYPNSAVALLLPTYAACFLGTTAFRSNVFDVAGTLVGAAFLAVVQSGLIMVGVQSWIAQIVQGTLLIVAVALSKAASRGVI
ncbi:MAG: ABC transporter permease [Microthrixaceae bacterium]